MSESLDAMQSRVRKSFGAQSLMRTLSAEMTSVQPGAVTIAMPHGEHLLQQHGFLHGGVVAAIADSACGYAALSLMPPEAAVLTSEFKINLLAPAKAEIYEAQGRVIRAGKRVHVVQADVFGVSGVARKHIALMTATMMVIEASQGLRS